MVSKTSPIHKAPVNTKLVGRSEDEWTKLHDPNYIIPKRIEDGIKALGKGWLYEGDFLRLISISPTQLAAFRDRYADHVVTLGGRNPRRAWWGCVKTAAKKRGEAAMQL